MDHPLLTEHEVIEGRVVNSNFRRLAEAIKDYDTNMELAWIPPENRLPGETHVFAIVLRGHAVRYLREDELKDTVAILEWIYNHDQNKTNVFANMNAHNAALENLKLRRELDEMEQIQDFAKHLFKSPKNRYRHNGRVYE